VRALIARRISHSPAPIPAPNIAMVLIGRDHRLGGCGGG
jgi:hypothetical protein